MVLRFGTTDPGIAAETTSSAATGNAKIAMTAPVAGSRARRSP